MTFRYLKYKLFWWAREHLFFYRNLSVDQKELEYELPDGYGDWAIHPCVRKLPDKLGGSHWWMVLSPYPGFDTSKENILLYKGEESDTSDFPVRWTFVREVRGVHSCGYNSDPNLYYDGTAKELWVIWREWGTVNVPDDSPLCCSMCSKTSDGIEFSSPKIIALNYADTADLPSDTEMCPTVMDFKGGIYLYGVHYSYEPTLFPQGLCRYEYDGETFKLSCSRPWANRLFDLWHIDMFQHDGVLYQLVTGRSGNAIYLGRSKNGIDFEYSRRPFFSWRWFLRKNYFYKASAVVSSGKIFLFFPRKRQSGSVRIVVRAMPVDKLSYFFD